MKLLTLLLTLLIFIYLCIRRYSKRRKSLLGNRTYDIKQWMLMDSAQRKKIDEEYKVNSMQRKKELLNKIREEYVNHKKNLKK